MDNSTKALIIDDDEDFGGFIFDVLQTMNLDCTVTGNAKDFMQAFNQEITLIFLDLLIPDVDGIELLRFLGKQQCKSNIILMSGVDRQVLGVAEDFGNSIGLSIVERIQKPIRLNELESIINRIINITLPVMRAQTVAPAAKFVVNEDELQRAINNDEFVLHYQPKVEIATRRIVGVEALVRWQHSRHGLIFPEEFIGFSETTGLIDAIGWLVIKKGLADIGRLNEKLKTPLKLSMNLSYGSLQDLTYPDKFIAMVNRFNFLPENIILEVTESGLLNGLSSALDIFTRLRMKKIELSIDDFGTGYAMMQQLKHIPATELKIDKSFIQDMLSEDNARVTVLKSIEIGHDLGMKVTAEGVETHPQLEFLRVNKCDMVQGFLFSKPLPVGELYKWIISSGIKC